MKDLLKKSFDDVDVHVRKENWPKTEKIFTVCSGPLSQSIGRGRISREGALYFRERRERWDKIVLKFSPEKQKKRAVLAWNFPFFLAGSLVVRESRDRRDRISDKNSQKRRRILFCVWDFFQKSKWKWVRIPWKKDFFGAKKITFGGGSYNFKTAASQWPSWGIYKYALPVFWRKRHLLYPYCEKKMAK